MKKSSSQLKPTGEVPRYSTFIGEQYYKKRSLSQNQ